MMKFIATKAVQVQYKHTIYAYTKEIKILEIKKITEEMKKMTVARGGKCPTHLPGATRINCEIVEIGASGSLLMLLPPPPLLLSVAAAGAGAADLVTAARRSLTTFDARHVSPACQLFIQRRLAAQRNERERLSETRGKS